jgi:hypothetical protein
MGKVGKNTMVRIADYVSPSDAAGIIGCTDGRIYQMLRDKEFRNLLPIGKNRVMILRKEAEKIASSPAKTGRPRKNISAKTA